MGFLKKQSPTLMERIFTAGTLESQLAIGIVQGLGAGLQRYFRHVEQQDAIALMAEERKATRDRAKRARKKAAELRKLFVSDILDGEQKRALLEAYQELLDRCE